jgi:hypothetical protein
VARPGADVISRKDYHGLSYMDQFRALSLPVLSRLLLKSRAKAFERRDWLNSDVFNSMNDQRSAFDIALTSSASVRFGRLAIFAWP